MQPRSTSLTFALLAPATMVVILAVALLLLMTPIWTHFAIAATGGVTEDPRTVSLWFQLSDRTVAELLLGPGTFSDYAAGEASHMRDARLVLYVFLGLGVASALLVGWGIKRAPTNPRTWLSIGRGGAALAVVLVVLGVFAALAFGVAFELFHRILFPGGNWAFDESSVLIRLYPYGFWQMSAAALGGLGVVGGLLVWFLARRRARSLAGGASLPGSAT